MNTIATNATHTGGLVELDVHNLWGTMEEKATREMLLELKPGERPFIVSRGTFAGAGKFTSHWVRRPSLGLAWYIGLTGAESLGTISASGTRCAP